tara:strand:- start:205 stop:876 length:672 start_codon:yes stop_codon:yes gene_type:complete
MNKIVTNYNEILLEIAKYKNKSIHNQFEPQLIAVSKTFPKETIEVLLNEGHRIFGENKVQEASKKWVELKKKYNNTELHLIGPLQSNKVALALKIFDVIQTLERDKIALKIKNYFDDREKVCTKRLFVQVNIGNEKQKSGVDPKLTKQFVDWCKNDLKLNIEGLMCIPPFGDEQNSFFIKLKQLCDDLKLKHASMGMSSDYKSAIMHGATYVRVGSGIFGARS